MNQSETTQKIIFELIARKIIDPNNAIVMEQYLNQIYSIGYNSGMRHNDNKVEVLKLNSHGTVLATYESLSDAERKTRIDLRNIQKVIKGERSRAGGYYWKLKNIEQ